MICRLCLKECAAVIDIFDELGVLLDAAKIVGKHFWFEPKMDDPISTVICKKCWLHLDNFHNFYVTIEEAHQRLLTRFSLNAVVDANADAAAETPETKTKAEQNVQNTEEKCDEETILAGMHNLVESEVPSEQDEKESEEDDFIDEHHYVVEQSAESEAAETFNGEILLEIVDDDDYDEEGKKEKEFISCVKQKQAESYALRRSTRCQTEKLQQTPKPDSKSEAKPERHLKKPGVIAEQAASIAEKQAVLKAAELAVREAELAANAETQPYESISEDEKSVSSKLHEETQAQEDNADSEVTSPTKKRVGRPRKSETLVARPSTSTKSANNQLKNCQADEEIASYMKLFCYVCGIELENFTLLRSHILVKHQAKPYVECCDKRFYKRTILHDHIKKHLNPEHFKCVECDKVFADKQCMRNHFLIKHQPETEKIYECNNCNKKFAKAYLLEQHRISAHGERTHICDICERGFPSTALLSNHLKMVHENYGRMCEICAKVIRGNAAFERHLLMHGDEPIPKVQCDKCGSWHKDKYSLQKHKKRHNEEGTPHVCTICGKKAPNRSALLSHNRYVHKASLKFECEICHKAFKKQISLKEHMSTHTGKVLYHCPHCSKTFISNANMHHHRKKMHPKEFEETRKNRLETAAQPVAKTKPSYTSTTTTRTESSAQTQTHFNVTTKTAAVEEQRVLELVIDAADYNGEQNYVIIETNEYSD